MCFDYINTHENICYIKKDQNKSLLADVIIVMKKSAQWFPNPLQITVRFQQTVE